nr:sporulation protein YjcZ [Paenibacillus turpanensis]
MAYAGGAAGSCGVGNVWTSTGTILVLFILLVIISRTVFFGA